MLDRAIEFLSPLALRQFCQVTLTVAALILLARWVGCRSAHWAYALLIVAALKCLCPPIWSMAVSPFCWWRDSDGGRPSQAVRPDEDESSESVTASTESVSAALVNDATTLRASAQVVRESGDEDADLPEEHITPGGISDTVTAQTATTSTAISSQVRDRVSSISMNWARIVQASLIFLWIAGSLALLLGIIIKRRRLAGLVARGEAVTAGPIYELVERLRTDLGLDVRLKVVILDEPGVPGVFGVRTPTVVLPRVVLDRMNSSELRLVLAHELNHLRRQDTVCGVVQLLALVVWWFHPLVWWMNSHLRRFREHCCDEEVVARLSCRPGEYARCLLNVLSLRQELQPVVGVSALSPFDVTAQRLKNLMRQERSFASHRSWLCVAASALLAFVLLPGAALPRETAVEVVETPPYIADGDWRELNSSEEVATVTPLYRSGIAEPEPVVPEPTPQPPELSYGFQPGESSSYHMTIEADDPEGVVTCDGTIVWQVHDVANGEITLSRLPTVIVRNQTPRARDGYFTLPTSPSITWHGMRGGPIAPMGAPRFPNPTIPRGPIGGLHGWPEGMESFGPQPQQGVMGHEHPASSFPGSPFAREADRFSLSGGAIDLGDPYWLPFGVGDAIDWVLPTMPTALDGGSTERTFSWMLAEESQRPHYPFAPTPEQGRETASWQIVEQRDKEWVLMRTIDRWSLAGGASESPETARHRLQGTALITWAVDLGRPRGIEFIGEFTRRAGGSLVVVPVTVQAILAE